MNLLTDIKAEAGLAEDELWYKDAVVYQLHVKAFADGNNDGIGDFEGLTQRLDYLQDLGVTTLWLLPFYPSPGRDDGYDIADYRQVNPDFGTLSDFRRFMHEAKRRKLRVITELVVNHTSDQHPWFRRARRSKPGSDARNWYVWSDSDQRYAGTRIIFSDTEKSNWAWDPNAQAYYWHRFFSHQPDLNFANPRVLQALMQVMRRWLDFGVDGFRLDAIPYLCEREGTNNENLPETHAIIKKIRAELDSYAPGRLLLAEANQWPEDVNAYFGDGDECHMAYHFPLMPRIYMAIAQEDRFPIADILRQTPDIPENCQWALFLRNHDELTLEMVTDVERDYLWSTYATDPRARLNLGIRRRLAPLMDNDRRKIELMNSLLMSFPGTPIIYYGDEIGMGDNIYLGDRNGVRTPMQWTPDRNGGFSRCDPARLYAPMIMDAVYGYESVNVEAQSRSLSSLLNWTKRLIAVRKSRKVFGRGSLTFIRPKNRSVLVYIRQYQGDVVLCVANLSRSAQAAEIDLSTWRGRTPIELLGNKNFPPIGDRPYVITLAPYGFFWFQLQEKLEKEETPTHVPELETLVVTDGWNALLQGRSRQILENDVLPNYLSSQRWYGERGQTPRTWITGSVPVTPGAPGIELLLVEAEGRNDTASYLLPLTAQWLRLDRSQRHPNAIAAVRRGPREGVMLDVCTDAEFITAVLDKTRAGETIEAGNLRLAFKPVGKFPAIEPVTPDQVRAVKGEQSNTTALVGNQCVVKLFRHPVPGINPEIEIGRFFAESATFTNTSPLIGTAELIRDGQPHAAIAIHGFVENQGDTWAATSAFLDRYVEEQRLLPPDFSGESQEQGAYLRLMGHVGKRLAEMQLALASRGDLPDFAPEPISDADLKHWTGQALERAQRIFAALPKYKQHFSEADQALADTLTAHAERLPAHLQSLLSGDVAAMKIRHHGDFHLGQMLLVKDDVYIIDFEGEPRRSLEERRQKAPAARDLAGLIRSIDYSVTAALERATRHTPDDDGKIARALHNWRSRSVEGVLTAYRSAMSDARLWPAEQPAAERLLDFFLLEKAFYEIEYEMAYRPEWLRVPLAGTLRILSRSEGSPA